MKFFKNFSFRQKILAIVGATFTIASIVIIASTFFIVLNIFTKYSKDNLAIFNTDQATEVGRVFANAEKAVDQAAVYQPVIDYMAGPKKLQDEQILDYFKSHNLGEEYSNIYLLDLKGNTVTSIDKRFLGNNYAFREYFKEAIAGNSFLDSDIGVTTGELGYYFSKPVKKNGQVVGVVVAKMKPEVVNSSLKHSNSYMNNSLMFTGQYGVVLYSEKSDRYMKSLGPLSEAAKAKIAATKRFGGKTVEALGYDQVQVLVDQKMTGVKVLDFFDKADNENEIVSIARIEGRPYFLVLEVEKEEIILSSLYVAGTTALIMMVAFGAAMTVTAIFVTKNLRPIETLKEAAEKIAVGKYGGPVEIKTGDELEELGKTFNKMAKSIEEDKKNLEQRVKDRTADIEEINKAMVGRELRMIELKKEIVTLKEKKEGKNENQA